MTYQSTPLSHKALTSRLYGGQSNYEWFKRASELPPFNRSPLYHSMLPEEKLINDIDVLAGLVKMCQQGVVKPQMLKYISLNVFGPAYVLMTHYEYFLRVLKKHAGKDLSEKVKQAEALKSIGGVLDDTVNMDLRPSSRPELSKVGDKYVIKQTANSAYFSSTSNLLMEWAIAFVSYSGEVVPVLVQLKDNRSTLLANVKPCYIGDTISTEHNLIGYNLNGYQVEASSILANSWSSGELTRYRHDWDYCLFELSLLELFKGCDLGIKYTQMRRQFKTIPGNKEAERPIGQYQAVLSRIVDALSLSYALAGLLNKVQNAQSRNLFAPYFQYTHHLIYEKLAKVRECCGGFGFIRWSGLPQVMERVLYRASLNRRDAPYPNNKQLLVTFSYYASSPDVFKEFLDPATLKSQFGYFGIVCICNRMNSESLNEIGRQQYIYDFVRDCAVQQLYGQERRFNYIIVGNPVAQLVKFMPATIALENPHHIDWKYTAGMQPNELLEYLLDVRNKSMTALSDQMQEFSRIFDFNHFGDIVLGRSNSKEFYDELLAVTKANRRNSADFLDFIRKPVADFLVENNSRL